jgi:hypothetical protein
MRQDAGVNPRRDRQSSLSPLKLVRGVGKRKVSSSPPYRASDAFCYPSQEDIPQHDRVVMKFVTRAEYQRNLTFACLGTQLRKLISIIVNLGRVAAAEFLPACRLVPKPLPQRRTGSNAFDPPIDGGIRLSHSSRPQAIDQYPRTIPRRR